jgi:5-hydroxyisourate hydrolase
MATSKSPISCHVLDTVLGRPGAGIKVTLSCLSAPNKQFGSIPHVFSAVTDADGRIKEWENKYGIEVWAIVHEGSDEADSEDGQGTTVWSLKFDTEHYYGKGKTFWPWVELTFRVKRGEHYHVPLLLGPYSYTTYRGS